MNTGIDKMLPFVQAMDAFFPIGAYTMSDGMETYTQTGIVRDEKSLGEYLTSYLFALSRGKLAFAARAARGDDFVRLDNLCAAFTSAKEMREGSRKLCIRFLKAQNAIGEYILLKRYKTAIEQKLCFGCFPVAVGLFIKELKINAENSLTLYCCNQLSATLNHAVKLVPLPQLDGQRALAAVLPKIKNAVQTAIACPESELGISAPAFELRSAQHEVLVSRMYIS